MCTFSLCFPRNDNPASPSPSLFPKDISSSVASLPCSYLYLLPVFTHLGLQLEQGAFSARSTESTLTKTSAPRVPYSYPSASTSWKTMYRRREGVYSPTKHHSLPICLFSCTSKTSVLNFTHTQKKAILWHSMGAISTF